MPKTIDKPAIFDDLKTILIEHTPNLTIIRDDPGRIEVAGDKPVRVGKQVKDRIFFASVMIQKHYVGFYFFPIYTHPHFFEDAPPEISKCLKGKSCFHIKKQDEQLYEQISALLKKGLEIYEADEWV